MSDLGGAAGRGDIGDVTSPNSLAVSLGGAKSGDVESVKGQGPERPFQVKLTFSRFDENDRI